MVSSFRCVAIWRLRGIKSSRIYMVSPPETVQYILSGLTRSFRWPKNASISFRLLSIFFLFNTYFLTITRWFIGWAPDASKRRWSSMLIEQCMIGSSHKVNLQGLHQAIEYTGHVDLQAIVQVEYLHESTPSSCGLIEHRHQRTQYGILVQIKPISPL